MQSLPSSTSDLESTGNGSRSTRENLFYQPWCHKNCMELHSHQAFNSSSHKPEPTYGCTQQALAVCGTPSPTEAWSEAQMALDSSQFQAVRILTKLSLSEDQTQSRDPLCNTDAHAHGMQLGDAAFCDSTEGWQCQNPCFDNSCEDMACCTCPGEFGFPSYASAQLCQWNSGDTQCGTVFSDTDAMVAHLLENHLFPRNNEVLLKCGDAVHWENVPQHVMQHSEFENNNNCEVFDCDFMGTLSEAQLSEHMELIHPPQDYAQGCCWRDCGQSASNPFELSQHIFTDHLHIDPRQLSLPTTITAPVSSKFSSLATSMIGSPRLLPENPLNSGLIDSTLHLHECLQTPLRGDGNAFDIDTKICKWCIGSTIDEVCGYRCKGSNELQTHLEDVHIGVRKQNDGARRRRRQLHILKCSWQGCEKFKLQKEYSQVQHLKEHISSHSGYKGETCPTCAQKLTNKAALLDHLHIHTGEKPFRCGHCNREFRTASTLKSHERSTHTGEKPYRCEVCNKAFAGSGNFSKHRAIHEDPKFSCLKCGKKFKRQQHLARHHKVHRRD